MLRRKKPSLRNREAISWAEGEGVADAYGKGNGILTS